MHGNLKDRWSVPVTAVADEFIDTYMAAANGEYVKVYLYALRHQSEEITIEMIADALNHTESDVRRALAYWEKAEVLTGGGKSGAGEAQDAEREHTREVSGDQRAYSGDPRIAAALQEETVTAEISYPKQRRLEPVYSAEQVNRLTGNEEFSQLLYIAQKYMNKVFTPRDCQAFAYLYEGLGMSGELLEYLVEYCVQNGHTSIRYIETVATSWHERGIRTALEAKEYAAGYNKDSFAVMKAFGLNSRKPAAPEQKLIDKWFREYGFSRDVVVEACSRTITAIHNPSFQYADKILTDWKAAGVRGMSDIGQLDARRAAAREDNAQAKERRLQRYETGVSAVQQGGGRKGAPNQFHNFKQRDTDYDALVLKQVKEWVGEQP